MTGVLTAVRIATFGKTGLLLEKYSILRTAEGAAKCVRSTSTPTIMGTHGTSFARIPRRCCENQRVNMLTAFFGISVSPSADPEPDIRHTAIQRPVDEIHKCPRPWTLVQLRTQQKQH